MKFAELTDKELVQFEKERGEEDGDEDEEEEEGIGVGGEDVRIEGLEVEGKEEGEMGDGVNLQT